MKLHVIPPDATITELEAKAAECEKQSANEQEPRATELREEAEALSRLGDFSSVGAVDVLSGP